MVVAFSTNPLAINSLLEQFLGPALVDPILYALGLAAVFLLAFRGRLADQVISFLLAVIWACMALALRLAEVPQAKDWQALVDFQSPGPLTWLAGLFAFQALLFIAEGVFRRSKDRKKSRLSFEPRASAGPVAGGLFLVYSLVVYPALAAHPVEPFETPLLGLPFHGVLFTFGILLFLERDFPREVLVVPLAWAAIGGLVAFNSGERDYALLAALLAGSLLALPRQRKILDVEGNKRLETIYEHAARHHRRCGRAALFMILATCLLLSLAGLDWKGKAPDLGFAHPLVKQLVISFSLLSALLLGVWLSLPAWYSAGFRLLAWEVGRWLRAGRRVWDWLTARWGGILLLLALLGFAAWWVLRVPSALDKAAATQAAAEEKQEDKDRQKDLILAGLSLILLLAIYRARKRIVISEFLNYTGDKDLDNLAKGLASRLYNELSSITSLYRTIDEAMPPQKGNVVGVTVGVEDVLKSLDDIVGPDSSVKLGKFEIPIGLLLRGLSRIVRGPTLTGSLHKEGQDYLVVAHLAGGGLSGTWRVSQRDLDPEELKEGTAAVYRMAEQLAYRIITGIGNLGSPRWEAVRHFTSGLRVYRATQLLKGDVSPELRQAELEFINALGMDRNFSQCHYNLGVVYQGLGAYESAEASYRQILEEDPDWSEAYYALATVYFDRGQLERAAIFSRKMIEIRPGDARAWNLNGIARYAHQDARARRISKLEQDFEGDHWDEIVRSFNIAAAVAWRSLCAAALRDSSKPLVKEKQIAVRCTTNVGIVRGLGGDGEGRRTILEQAFRLSKRNARAHLICGASLFEDEEWQEARTELYQVFGDALDIDDHVERWIYLLGVHSVQKDEPNARHAYLSILNHAVPPESMILSSRWDEAAEAERSREYQQHLAHFETQSRLVQEKLRQKTGEDDFPRFDSVLRLIRYLRELERGTGAALGVSLLSHEEGWAQAQKRIREARLGLTERPEWARKEIEGAIEILSKDHSRQIERQGLQSLLAKAYLLEAVQGNDSHLLMKAIEHAEVSTAQEPGSAARRWILGDVYAALGDFEEASKERETALNLGPSCEILDDPRAMSRVARDYLRLAGLPEQPAPEPRLRRGLTFFKRILQLVESRKANRSEARFAAHAAAHFWVGRFHCELGENEQGIDHLQIARSMTFRQVEIGLRLGNVYFRQQHYDEAERAFQESLAATNPNTRAGRRGMLLADEGPTEPIEVEALLNWAMLCAERGVRLEQALSFCERAQSRLAAVVSERRRAELEVLLHECLGWIYFQCGRIEDSRSELEQAALASGARSIQARLAQVYEAAGQSGLLDKNEANRKARVARERARARPVISSNGQSRGIFDLWLLPEEDNKPLLPTA
ncbi:MAG TPA: DUF6064 family protein [Thermoanaerobaculia bacterium]|nr:DUF6064 family protein [Thermoanaerobaculia bacterium]